MTRSHVLYTNDLQIEIAHSIKRDVLFTVYLAYNLHVSAIGANTAEKLGVDSFPFCSPVFRASVIICPTAVVSQRRVAQNDTIFCMPYNFIKYQPIFEFVSLSESGENLQ